MIKTYTVQSNSKTRMKVLVECSSQAFCLQQIDAFKSVQSNVTATEPVLVGGDAWVSIVSYDIDNTGGAL